MKFTVREGFVVHDTKVVKINNKVQEQTNSYYEGDEVDFDAATALAHAHKLTPADKASSQFIDKSFPALAEVQASTGVGGDAGAQITALARQVSELTGLIGQLTSTMQSAVSGPAQ